MISKRFLGIFLLALCIFLVACNKETEPDVTTVDPNTLEEGTIVFDLNGKTVKTVEGAAGFDGTTTIGIGNLVWVEVVGTDVITRTLSLSIFGIDPILEKSYDIVWDECSNDTSLPCGVFIYNSDEPENSNNLRTQTSDTFLKIDFQTLGQNIGDKVIGTFEARASDLGGTGDADDRFNITNGAFNVTLQ